MIYYFLPDNGIFGGVKVACSFMDLLGRLGMPGAVVLPGGTAPFWFNGQIPVLSETSAGKRVTSKDWLMFTWPPDYERLKTWPGRLICHCQGTDQAMHPVFADQQVPVLTCWRQAQDYVQQHFGRRTFHVGISIPNRFYFGGGLKVDNLVAYMPRRGFALVRRAMRKNPLLDFTGLDGLCERDVAAGLNRAGFFLATAVGEQFGLPALEAMAAGCVVLSVPVKGGREYLHDGWNCLMAAPDALGGSLHRMARHSQAGLRSAMRARAMATASAYSTQRQLYELRLRLQGELKWLH